MDFLSFIILIAIAYLIWRISDQIPDILFRLSEIQRDLAELRRRSDEANNPSTPTQEPTRSSDTE